jgi:uncharacterized lipoprotein YbaY
MFPLSIPPRHIALGLLAACALALAACGARENVAPARQPLAQTQTPPLPASDQPAGWKAVLLAGDDQEPAFDNAVDTMARKLASFGLRRDDMAVLKADGAAFEEATGVNIRNAFATLAPTPRQGCFVFVTSHGAPGRGLVLKRARVFLTPGGLDQLLDQSCADRPTVVIASGCYSGIFATQAPLPAPNRTILTAARPDRPSFGCNASREYTVFDKCVLDSLERGLPWRAVMDKTRACVAGNETALHVNAPSEPQLYVGPNETGLRVFSR